MFLDAGSLLLQRLQSNQPPFDASESMPLEKSCTPPFLEQLYIFEIKARCAVQGNRRGGKACKNDQVAVQFDPNKSLMQSKTPGDLGFCNPKC